MREDDDAAWRPGRGRKRSTCSLVPSAATTVSSDEGGGKGIIDMRTPAFGFWGGDRRVRAYILRHLVPGPATAVTAPRHEDQRNLRQRPGESSTPGSPARLVRTTGCDLRCGYCDSAFAFYGGKELSLDDIATEVRRLGAPLVLLTGGEPMLQREIGALATRLLDDGYRVMIETSGAHPIDSLPAAVVRIVDVKTPGSGEAHRIRWDVLDGLRGQDAVKSC